MPSQTAAHKTGIPIAALDISPDRQHAVLAGKEILKTVAISDGKVTEEINLRSTISSYASTHSTESQWTKRRDYLPAGDVKWSHGQYDTIIATAANHGRIALYDVTRAEVEHARIHEHTRTVHRLGFNPHQGYLLLSGSQDGAARIWDLRQLSGDRAGLSTKSFRQFDGRADAIRDVRWSPTEGLEFAVCTDNGTIQIWDLRYNNGPKLKLNGHGKPCMSVDYHPDGWHIVSGGSDKYVRVWDTRKDRRQKPTYELRTPQAITNVRWRPACWSSEMQGIGNWQSTQLATTYTQDDPRCHIWDLRRPFIPFRELDRYNSPATDLLWRNKDLLWTVGNEGMFTQNDVNFATQVHHELPPCTVDWFPHGEYVIFAEDKEPRRDSNNEDPAVGFLNVPQEKLSSGEQAAVSPNDVSDEDLDHDGFFTASFRRRQSRAASSKSVKSRTSSPSFRETGRAVLPLEQAVSREEALFNNNQVGFISSMPVAIPDPEVVEHLVNTYARASTRSEREAEPEMILDRLEAALHTNASASDDVAMYRLGQTWRILSAVIIPELKDWAHQNRKERLDRQTSKASSSAPAVGRSSKPVNDDELHRTPSGAPVQSAWIDKLGGEENLPGLAVWARQMMGENGTSDVATPLARPLPDSPASDRGASRRQYGNLGEVMETMPPLPPSVMASHSTAAAASRALHDDGKGNFPTPPSSPESSRNSDSPHKSHRRTGTADSVISSSSMLAPPRTAPQAIQTRSPSGRSQHASPRQVQREGDRRSALKDYRAQPRPVLTFDEPDELSVAGRSGQDWRHDSNESFQMFSASTDSSRKAKSLGRSLESPQPQEPASASPEYFQYGAESFEPSSPPRNESYDAPVGLGVNANIRAGGPVLSALREPSDTLAVPFEMDHEPRRKDEKLSISSSPDEPFHFEEHVEASRQAFQKQAGKAYRTAPAALAPRLAPGLPTTPPPGPEIDLSSPNYIPSDFRPIDISSYAPKTPLAWSALTLIAHIVAFDLSSGQPPGLFSTHLLTHVHPFFYDHTFQTPPNFSTPHSSTVEKLTNAGFAHRIIESILTEHTQYLQKMRLFVPLAELRRVCAEFGYADLAQKDEQNKLALVCARCGVPMQDGGSQCTRCRKVRDPCPVCLSQAPRGWDQMWAHCPACGHGAHVTCMQAWLGDERSGGECPTRNCGCDCGPGVVREGRIARQVREVEDGKLVQGTAAEGVKKEQRFERVAESRAVERTRRVLRAGEEERATQSGDETGGGRRSPRMSRAGFGGRGKVVRVMVPGEEASGS